MHFGLDYRQGDGVILVGYMDLDWAGCASDRKSNLGCCFGLGSTILSWTGWKQYLVEFSSTKVEYMATILASCEAISLRKVLFGLFG